MGCSQEIPHSGISRQSCSVRHMVSRKCWSLSISISYPFSGEITGKLLSETLKMCRGVDSLDGSWIPISGPAVVACRPNREAQAHSESQQSQDSELQIAARLEPGAI